MEITPVSATRSALTADLAASRERWAAARAAAPAPRVARRSSEVSVVTRRDDPTGAMVTTVADAVTGEVIAQVPIQQVLDLVATLLEQRRDDLEGSDRGEH